MGITFGILIEDVKVPMFDEREKVEHKFLNLVKFSKKKKLNPVIRNKLHVSYKIKQIFENIDSSE